MTPITRLSSSCTGTEPNIAVSNFEAGVRHLPRFAVVYLHSEFNAYAREKLDAAYAEGEGLDLKIILLNFSDVAYIQAALARTVTRKLTMNAI